MILKAIRLSVAVASMFLFSTATLSAQSRIDVYFGMGSAHASSSGLQFLDASGNPATTPSLGGVFGIIGGGVFLKPSFGVGAQVSWRFTQGDYLAYGYRPLFYDFNGIWTPISAKRVMPEFQAGFGGASLRFYNASQPYYDYNTGRYSTFAGSSNHLQLHLAAGLRFFIKPHLFVRPQLDYHWVRNLTNEFGSNSVPEYTIAIGYSSRETR
jgi:hypothetical protein